MGTALVKLKIMPESPATDLEKIKKEAEKIILKDSKPGLKITFEEEPIAFGLKALIAGFAIDESKAIDPVQDKIRAIKDVKSAEVHDFRRAFG